MPAETDEPDVATLPLAKHPPGCGCAMHLRMNGKPVADAVAR
jgi:5-methyltetrahydrofolate--homocysteine methyltransferase